MEQRSRTGAVALFFCLALQADERIEAFQTVMGTQFRVTVYAADIVKAQAAIKAAFARAVELDQKLSDYKPESELNQLCRARRMRVSDDLYTVLAYAQRVSKESGGAFDVTLGPLIQQWRESRKTGILPSQAQIAEARRRAGFRNLKLRSDNIIELKKSGMQLDLGAIAKGYAADQMLHLLRESGFTRALVAASGDLAIGEAPPGRAGWRVELGATGEMRELRNCGVSSSGDEQQYAIIDGVRYSHIIDPKTGIGITAKGMTTVVARTGMEADAWATAWNVTGKHGLQLRHAKAPGKD